MNEKKTAKVLKYTRKIESNLEDLGAKGKGLHQKISSIKKDLSKGLIKKLRSVADIRNKSMHQPDFELKDFDSFKKTCKEVIDALENLNKNKGSNSLLVIIIVIVIIILFVWWLM